MAHGDTRDDPLTHGGTDRRGRWCKCSECGRVEMCCVAFDFYIRPSRTFDAPLTCEQCLMAVPASDGGLKL